MFTPTVAFSNHYNSKLYEDNQIRSWACLN